LNHIYAQVGDDFLQTGQAQQSFRASTTGKGLLRGTTVATWKRRGESAKAIAEPP